MNIEHGPGYCVVFLLTKELKRKMKKGKRMKENKKMKQIKRLQLYYSFG